MKDFITRIVEETRDNVLSNNNLINKYLKEFEDSMTPRMLNSSNSDTANVRQGDSSADVCEWEQDQDGVYFTKCDNAFFFDTGGIADNKGKYCFYCGKVIKEIKAKEQTA